MCFLFQNVKVILWYQHSRQQVLRYHASPPSTTMSDEDEPVLVPSGKAVHYGSLEASERARQSGETSGQDVMAEAKEAGNINISECMAMGYSTSWILSFCSVPLPVPSIASMYGSSCLLSPLFLFCASAKHCEHVWAFLPPESSLSGPVCRKKE